MDYIVHPAPLRRKIGSKSKSPDKRPARKRYWARRRLETRKVKQLMRWGMDGQEAVKVWQKQRQGRVPTGWLRQAG